MLWKVPAHGANERLALHVRLPADCKIVTPLTAAFTGTSYIERSRIVRTGGLAGRTIAIEGLSTTLTDVLVRVERTDGTTQMMRLTPDQPSFVVEATSQPLEVAHTYLVLGIEHILFGVDHLLFVLALLILVRGRATAARDHYCGHIPVALLFFNLGVEAGQLLFIAAVLSLVTLMQRVKLPVPRWVELVLPYVIGSVAMFWVIQRISAF